MTDKQHLAKAKTMPIKFLKASGKGFFIDKEGYALAIREDLREVVKNDAFCEHMKDILEYRTMDYYRRRYKGEQSKILPEMICLRKGQNEIEEYERMEKCSRITPSGEILLA